MCQLDLGKDNVMQFYFPSLIFSSHHLQVLEKDNVMKRFQEVSSQLEQALGQISFDDLDVSDEVREQVSNLWQSL